MEMDLRLFQYCRLFALNCSVLAKKMEVGLPGEPILLARPGKPRQVETSGWDTLCNRRRPTKLFPQEKHGWESEPRFEPSCSYWFPFCWASPQRPPGFTSPPTATRKILVPHPAASHLLSHLPNRSLMRTRRPGHLSRVIHRWMTRDK